MSTHPEDPLRGLSPELTDKVRRQLAARYLEDLKFYGRKAREYRQAGDTHLAERFHAFAMQSGRQWLALVAADRPAGRFGVGRSVCALRSIANAYASGHRVVTNLQLVR